MNFDIRRQTEAGLASPATATWRMTLSGFCASLVGIGIARFAYTPLLPAIIAAHWFTASTAAYLGAANLGGYLAGALLARPMSTVWPCSWIIRTMMGVAGAAFLACAVPLSFLWFFGWRFASGLAGGALMVLAAPTVLAHVPPSRRGFASGVIFMGVGAGIAASGTLVPLLLRHGLSMTWVGLGLLSLALTIAAWRGWPDDGVAAAGVAVRRGAGHGPALRVLYVQYALNAVGLVPHMIFLVDFVARGMGQGLRTGAQYWVLFGLGALVGPLVIGRLADRVGCRRALRLAYLIEAIAVVLPALGSGRAWLMLSSVVVGAFTPGIVPLALGRIHELLPHHPTEQKAAWSAATTAFALLQAAGAYGMSYLFAAGGSYPVLFASGAAAMALALLIDLVVSPGRDKEKQPSAE